MPNTLRTAVSQTKVVPGVAQRGFASPRAMLLRTPSIRCDIALAARLLFFSGVTAAGRGPRSGLPISEERLYVNGLKGGDPAVINLILAVIEATSIVFVVSLSLLASSISLLLSSVFSASSSEFAQNQSYNDSLSLPIHIGR